MPLHTMTNLRKDKGADPAPQKHAANNPHISSSHSQDHRSFKDSLPLKFMESPFYGIGRSENAKTILVLPMMYLRDLIMISWGFPSIFIFWPNPERNFRSISQSVP